MCVEEVKATGMVWGMTGMTVVFCVLVECDIQEVRLGHQGVPYDPKFYDGWRNWSIVRVAAGESKL